MNPQHAGVAFVVLLLIGGSASAWWYWNSDTVPERVEELKTKLIAQTSEEGVTERQLQRTTESLMREFDQLTPEQRKSAQEQLRKESHERTLAAAKEWKQLPEEERAAFLDVKLAEGANYRRVYRAMYADNVPRVSKRFLKEYAESEEGKAAEAKRKAEIERRRAEWEKRKAEWEKRKAEGGEEVQRGDSPRGGDRRSRDGRRRGSRGDRSGDNETDPDKLLIREFYRAIGQHMRSKGRGWGRSGRSRGGPGA